jgi:phosphoglycolate phosphatase-like HAD superfamily hydrolase
MNMFRFNSNRAAEVKPASSVVKPLVIFDFDGAIANSLEHILFIAKAYADNHKLKVSLTSYKDLIDARANLSGAEMFKMVFAKKSNVVKATADRLAEKIRETPVYAGLKDAVGKLRELGIIIGIITTNRATTVTEFLAHNALSEYFDFVKSSEGETKTQLLVATIKEHKSEKDHTFYVSGRTDYMLESAVRKVAKSVGAAWGFDSMENFAKAKADHVCQTPEELINVLNHPLQAQVTPASLLKSENSKDKVAAVTSTPEAVKEAVEPVAASMRM